MRNPLVGRVTSEFSPTRVHPVTKVRTQHWGIDIGAPAGVSPQSYIGAPVRAAYAGRVERAGWGAIPYRSGIGVLIRNPDGEAQYYGHLSRADVRVGQRVAEGQVIGGMGATGNVTGPHLHFETHNSGSNSSNGFSRVRNPRRDFRAAGITPGVDNPPGPSITPGSSSSIGGTVSYNWPRTLESHITGNDLSPGNMLRDTQRKAHQASRLSDLTTSHVSGNQITLRNVLRDAQRKAHQASRGLATVESLVTGNDIPVQNVWRYAQLNAHNAHQVALANSRKIDALADAVDEVLGGQGKIADAVKRIEAHIEPEINSHVFDDGDEINDDEPEVMEEG